MTIWQWLLNQRVWTEIKYYLSKEFIWDTSQWGVRGVLVKGKAGQLRLSLHMWSLVGWSLNVYSGWFWLFFCLSFCHHVSADRWHLQRQRLRSQWVLNYTVTDCIVFFKVKVRLQVIRLGYMYTYLNFHIFKVSLPKMLAKEVWCQEPTALDPQVPLQYQTQVMILQISIL